MKRNAAESKTTDGASTSTKDESRESKKPRMDDKPSADQSTGSNSTSGSSSEEAKRKERLQKLEELHMRRVEYPLLTLALLGAL